MKLTFDLNNITNIEFYNNELIMVWVYGINLDITFNKRIFEGWLETKEYDPNITYDHKDVFEARVKEFLESKCIDEPVPANNSALIKESLDLALQLGKKLISLNTLAQNNQ